MPIIGFGLVPVEWSSRKIRLTQTLKGAKTAIYGLQDICEAPSEKIF